MDFLSLVQQGVGKSNQSKISISEVDSVFDSINVSLKNFPKGELRVERSISNLAGIAGLVGRVGKIESEYFDHDRILIFLKVNGVSGSEVVAGWKQHVTGYPCILKFGGQEISCSNKANLVAGISELLASIVFGNAINSLLNQVHRTPQKTPVPAKAVAPLATIPRAAAAAAKPAAKTAAKKPAAKKPAVKKPMPSAPVAKPAAPKPTASSKPPAKPPAKSQREESDNV